MAAFSWPRTTSTGLSTLVLLLQLLLAKAQSPDRATSIVPAILVFGDSIVDTGNNNDLPTLIKSNFPPHGQDFPGHQATGRFCNGKIASDILGSQRKNKYIYIHARTLIACISYVNVILYIYIIPASKVGVKEIMPPYLGSRPGDGDLLTGVAFASAGTGYDPITAQVAVILSQRYNYN